MKRCHLFLFVLLLAGRSKAQSVTCIDTLDFIDSKDKLQSKTLRYNKKVCIYIKNINRNIFKVEDTFKEKEFNTSPPATFTGLKLPGFISPGGAGSTSNLLGLSSVDIPPQNEKDKANYDALIRLVQQVEIYSEKIDNSTDLNNTFLNLASNCDLPYSNIRDSAIHSILAYQNLSVPLASFTDYAESLRDSINSYLDKVLSAKVQFYKILNPLMEVGDKSDLDLSEFDGLVDDVKKFKQENKIEILISNLEKLSEAYFTYTTKPVTPKKDEIEINIDISAEKLNCKRNVPVNYNQTYKIIGGLKIDFSTGVFFSMGSHDFKGRDLEYVPEGSDSTVIINDKNSNNALMISIGALAHFYRRTNKTTHLAFSPGVSTTLNFDAVNIHVGGSIIFGRENRGILTIGPVFRETKILRNGYGYNKEYLKKLLPDDPPTSNKFPAVGAFIAFTYNISRFQKSE